jgi:hypothetical protein
MLGSRVFLRSPHWLRRVSACQLPHTTMWALRKAVRSRMHFDRALNPAIMDTHNREDRPPFCAGQKMDTHMDTRASSQCMARQARIDPK